MKNVLFGLLICFLGKRGSIRGSVSDHEGGWNDESWGFSQAATSNPKKLKKSKSKEETTPG